MFVLYNETLATAVSTEFPFHHWKAWNFDKTPTHWWPDLHALFACNDPVALQVVRDVLNEIVVNYSIEGGLDGLTNEEQFSKISRADRKRLTVLGPIREVLGRLNSSRRPSAEHQIPIQSSNWNLPQSRRELLEKILQSQTESLGRPPTSSDLATLYAINSRDFIQHYGTVRPLALAFRGLIHLNS